VKRKKLDPHNATILEVAYAKTGSMLKAARVVAFVFAWGQARKDLGSSMSVEDFAEYWGESVATAYRQQALFREVFDLCRTPDPVLDMLEVAGGERLDLGEVVAA